MDTQVTGVLWAITALEEIGQHKPRALVDGVRFISIRPSMSYEESLGGLFSGNVQRV